VSHYLTGFVSLVDQLLQRCRHVAGQRLQLILCQLQLVLQPGQVQDVQLVVGHLQQIDQIKLQAKYSSAHLYYWSKN